MKAKPLTCLIVRIFCHVLKRIKGGIYMGWWWCKGEFQKKVGGWEWVGALLIHKMQIVSLIYVNIGILRNQEVSKIKTLLQNCT